MINAMEKLRTFIAITLPRNVTARIENIQSGLKDRGVDIRWVPPENIHLTLRFLGDISLKMRKEIETAIEATGNGFSPFKIGVKGIGVFPGIRNARVVWAGIFGEIDTLFTLQRILECQLSNVGIKREKRPFKAHLTIGRIKKKIDPAHLLSCIDACSDFEIESFCIDRVILFKSELKPTGAVYTPIYQSKL